MSERPAPPLRSEFHGDPDLAELVELFLSEIPDRVRAIQRAWNARELPVLSRLAHQLRGSSAGYGFPSLGRAAGAVEDALLGANSCASADLERLAAQVDDLVALCRRAVLSARS
jgi:HPt (histidine-containing phosphotransfer) domain-containing protein